MHQVLSLPPFHSTMLTLIVKNFLYIINCKKSLPLCEQTQNQDRICNIPP